MELDEAMEFIRTHGVVLERAGGAIPSLVNAIAGETVRGSWWAHPKAHEIYHLLGAVAESGEVLRCRLVDGKVTLIHRRLWPALLRLADRWPPDRLAAIEEYHTEYGKHVTRSVPLLDWAPAEAKRESKKLDAEEAEAILGAAVMATSGRTARGLGRTRGRRPRK
jgi:hypothetical protein